MPQMLYTDFSSPLGRTVLSFVFWPFELARPVKYGMSYFWFDLRDSSKKSDHQFHAELLNRVKVSGFGFRVSGLGFSFFISEGHGD
jgi:hypothetical protein